MNILPIALTAAGAIPNIIGGIMSAVLAGKKLSGGRLRRRHHKKPKRHHMKKGKGLARMKRRGGKVKRHHKKRKHIKRGRGGRVKRHYKMKGRGVVADTLGNIPLLGALLGPLAKAFGGKLKRMPKRNRKAAIRALIHRLRGRGLSPMYIRRPYVSSGCGLPSMGMIHAPRIGGRHGNTHRMSNTVKAILRGGNGLSPMYIRRPYTGGRLGPVGSDSRVASKSYLTPALATAALNKMYPGMKNVMSYQPVRTPPSGPIIIPFTPAGPRIMPVTPYNPPIPGPGTKGIASIDSRDNYLSTSTALVPYTGKGLLMPAGARGGLIHRKGHLRKIKGKKHKVRVKPALVGRGLLAPAGGYMPYGGHYGVYRR